MAEDGAGFQRLQRAFVAHVRDPDGHPAPPDVPERRLAVYRELVFNNLESFIATGFPVLHGLLPAPRWRALIRDFQARHRSTTPLFIGIAEEFLDYLAGEYTPAEDDPPYLPELAHYEWLELALATAIAEPPPLRAPTTPLSERRLLLSPVAARPSYRHPVHRIGPGQPDPPPSETPTCLLVYRDRADEVRFMEINPVVHRLLERAEQAPEHRVGQHLDALAAEIAHPDPARMREHGLDLLAKLHEKGAVDLPD